MPVLIYKFCNARDLITSGHARRGPDRSYLHDVVGDDGVLIITADGPTTTRLEKTTDKLRSAGIHPTRFSATMVNGTRNISDGCHHHADPTIHEFCGEDSKPDHKGRKGEGCQTKIEQAITDSHRRALLQAQERNATWTAIIEDDAVPANAERFDEAFKNAWSKVPPETRIIRLGWCTFEQDRGPIKYRDFIQADDAQLVSFMYWTNWYDNPPSKMYYVGGCTTGYMVHKDILPEMLGMFPCCCPIDCCMSWDLFFAPGHGDAPWDPRGHQIMMSLDAVDSRGLSEGFATFNQSGLLVQDNRDTNSSRPEWNTTDE